MLGVELLDTGIPFSSEIRRKLLVINPGVPPAATEARSSSASSVRLDLIGVGVTGASCSTIGSTVSSNVLGSAASPTVGPPISSAGSTTPGSTALLDFLETFCCTGCSGTEISAPSPSLSTVSSAAPLKPTTSEPSNAA